MMAHTTLYLCTAFSVVFDSKQCSGSRDVASMNGLLIWCSGGLGQISNTNYRSGGVGAGCQQR